MIERMIGIKIKKDCRVNTIARFHAMACMKKYIPPKCKSHSIHQKYKGAFCFSSKFIVTCCFWKRSIIFDKRVPIKKPYNKNVSISKLYTCAILGIEDAITETPAVIATNMSHFRRFFWILFSVRVISNSGTKIHTPIPRASWKFSDSWNKNRLIKVIIIGDIVL